ncbi:sigma-70 family RNA polymerase sigma factor [Mycoplasmatota bacterium WC44]
MLYLISEGNEKALEIMLEKYQNLILSKIYKFNISYNQKDDFYQEGCLALLNSIHVYNPKYNKSFTRFFEMVLTRKFISLIKKESKPLYIVSDETLNNYIVSEDERYYIKEKDIEYAKRNLSSIEYDVFYEHYYLEKSIDDIVKKFGYTEKRIYNAIYRIKRKMKPMREFS